MTEGDIAVIIEAILLFILLLVGGYKMYKKT